MCHIICIVEVYDVKQALFSLTCALTSIDLYISLVYSRAVVRDILVPLFMGTFLTNLRRPLELGGHTTSPDHFTCC